MRVYLKEIDFQTAPTFLILPGAYASHRYGSYVNQSLEALSKHFSKFNVIAFDGFLSPAFIKFSCLELIWNIPKFSQDLYARLSVLLDTLGVPAQNTGILGFSGGGTVGLHLIYQDSLLQNPLFAGSFIASPVLDQKVAFF